MESNEAKPLSSFGFPSIKEEERKDNDMKSLSSFGFPSIKEEEKKEKDSWITFQNVFSSNVQVQPSFSEENSKNLSENNNFSGFGAFPQPQMKQESSQNLNDWSSFNFAGNNNNLSQSGADLNFISNMNPNPNSFNTNSNLNMFGGDLNKNLNESPKNKVDDSNVEITDTKVSIISVPKSIEMRQSIVQMSEVKSKSNIDYDENYYENACTEIINLIEKASSYMREVIFLIFILL